MTRHLLLLALMLLPGTALAESPARQIYDLHTKTKEAIARNDPACHKHLEAAAKLLSKQPDEVLARPGIKISPEMYAECLMIQGKCEEGQKRLDRPFYPAQKRRFAAASHCPPSSAKDLKTRWERQLGNLYYVCTHSFGGCSSGACKATLQQTMTTLKTHGPPKDPENLRRLRSQLASKRVSSLRCLTRIKECPLAGDAFLRFSALSKDPTPYLSMGIALPKCALTFSKPEHTLPFEFGRLIGQRNSVPGLARETKAFLKLHGPALDKAPKKLQRRLADPARQVAARLVRSTTKGCDQARALLLDADRWEHGPKKAKTLVEAREAALGENCVLPPP